MPAVDISPVESRRDRRAFLDLPFELYRDDPNWIPRLRHSEGQLVGYHRHPFHEIAQVQTFLARQNGVPCGRIAAIDNRHYNQYYGQSRGFFGFFESVRDPAVAHGLFDAARAWLAQRGIDELRGPVNPSMNYDCGLLIDGFDSPPTFMMPYNPPWYAELVESYGFERVEDLHAYLGEVSQLPAAESKLGRIADQVSERFEAKVRPVNKRHFTRDVSLFLEEYNKAMVQTWDFLPITPGEMREMASTLRFLLIPELTLIVEVDGQPEGVVLGLPDYNPVIRQIRGRLLPLGFVRLLWSKRKLRRMRVLAISVSPEFQRFGLGLVLMRAMVPKAIEMGYCEAEFSYVVESNHLAIMGLQKGGARLYKEYRMYDYRPGPVNAPATSPPA